MKFAHLADCHIGSWRDPKLRDITTKAFCEAVDRCIKDKIDFMVISGDLFNTSLPSLDLLKVVVNRLRRLKNEGIPVYGIAGSHDYSPSGKTMLDILEEAGLYKSVAIFEEAGEKIRLKFTQDQKTGIKLTGIIGKKGGLEKEYFHYIDHLPLEQEPGTKIFLFHTSIEELKPEHLKEMQANPISLLPKGFDYYAGGHVHIVKKKDLPGYKNVVYPGPLFPNSFSELEKLDCGGFYMVDVVDGQCQATYVPVIIHSITNLEYESEYQTPKQVTEALLKKVDRAFDKAVVTIRLSGFLREGTVGDIGFKDVFDRAYERGAHFVMKNTAKLRSSELEEIKVKHESVEKIEEIIINEQSGQLKEFSPTEQQGLAKVMLQVLSVQKDDGERVIDYEDKIISDMDVVVKDIATKEDSSSN